MLRHRMLPSLLALACVALPEPAFAASGDGDTETSAVYRKRCAECHGERRYGGYAPPLIPATLSRKSDDALARAVLEGLPNTQMPAFGEQLTAAEITSLLGLMRSPVGEIRWSMADMERSRVELPIERIAIPPSIRRENLVLVVERGSGSVSVLDGDRMCELDLFAVGRIHGGLKFDRRLRQALAVTRDGTLADYDLVEGGLRTKIKAGVNTRNVAVSSDGAWVAAANQLPQGLVVFDARLRPLALFPLPGQPSAVYELPAGRRFVLTLRDLPFLYSLRHDSSDPRELTLEKVDLPEPFEDFVFVPGRTQLVASSRGGSRLLLYDYEQHSVIASLPTQGLPHLFSASFFERNGRLHAAFNHMGVPRLSVVEMDSFEVVSEIPLSGAGFFTRTHPGTPYLWIDTNTESIQLVEKASLELLDEVLTPAPGKKAMHVEFTAEGDRALVSVWHRDGAVVVYDSRSLAELGRLPYTMPVGKYNTANKTRVLRQTETR